MKQLLTQIAKALGAKTTSREWQDFLGRFETHGAHLHALFYALYGQRADFEQHFATLIREVAQSWLARDSALKTRDAEREANPRWFQSEKMVGGIAYVDLFAGDLAGLRAKLPYFKELGLTYLHLMPLFKAPEGNSDGGYAVSSYREVNPSLGTMAQLRELADELRQEGISLCLDFIFNHTSDEHEWAKRALSGDPVYRDFYHIMPRAEADSYDPMLREIFPINIRALLQRSNTGPAIRRISGCGPHLTAFNSICATTTRPCLSRWPSEMLFIANVGVDVLRMDAVAFIWKQLGTVCENLPEAHTLIQAFNAVARIAAPSLLFKS